jgi:hypothetical protein
VGPVHKTVLGHVADDSPAESADPAILSVEHDGEWNAVAMRASHEADAIHIPEEGRKRLGISVGDAVAWTPLPPPDRLRRDG